MVPWPQLVSFHMYIVRIRNSLAVFPAYTALGCLAKKNRLFSGMQ